MSFLINWVATSNFVHINIPLHAEARTGAHSGLLAAFSRKPLAIPSALICRHHTGNGTMLQILIQGIMRLYIKKT